MSTKNNIVYFGSRFSCRHSFLKMPDKDMMSSFLAFLSEWDVTTVVHPKNAFITGAKSCSISGFSHMILSYYIDTFQLAPIIYEFIHDVTYTSWICPLKNSLSTE